jgi:hypothetical protein
MHYVITLTYAHTQAEAAAQGGSGALDPSAAPPSGEAISFADLFKKVRHSCTAHDLSNGTALF